MENENNVNEVVEQAANTEEVQELSTEEKKKAINLQDLIYVKKYIDDKASEEATARENAIEAAVATEAMVRSNQIEAEEIARENAINAEVEARNTAIESQFKKNILDLLYPVGSLYMSSEYINPVAHLGGYWIPWGDGKILRAKGNNDHVWKSDDDTEHLRIGRMSSDTSVTETSIDIISCYMWKRITDDTFYKITMSNDKFTEIYDHIDSIVQNSSLFSGFNVDNTYDRYISLHDSNAYGYICDGQAYDKILWLLNTRLKTLKVVLVKAKDGVLDGSTNSFEYLIIWTKETGWIKEEYKTIIWMRSEEQNFGQDGYFGYWSNGSLIKIEPLDLCTIEKLH